MFLSILPIGLEQGLSYALVALGIILTFRVLSFPDLTVDGSFPLGGAVCARLIIEGFDPIIATMGGMMAGFIAGCLTGLLHTRLKINSLLSGILMMTILYSINLRVMGRANIPLLTTPTVFTDMEQMAIGRDIPIIIFFFLVIFAVKFLTDAFLHTEYGLALRATGDNEQMIRSLGVNTDTATVLGLGLSNAMVGLAGGLIAQDQGFADVGMGIGLIVAGLASVIIGEVAVGGIGRIISFFTNSSGNVVMRLTMAAILGSVAYRLIIALGLRLGLPPTDLKLATGIMVIIALGLPAIRGAREGKMHMRGV